MNSAYRVNICFFPNNHPHTLTDPGFSFGGQVQVERRSCEFRGAAGDEWWVCGGVWGGLCPLSGNVLDFLPRNGAFCMHCDT